LVGFVIFFLKIKAGRNKGRGPRTRRTHRTYSGIFRRKAGISVIDPGMVKPYLSNLAGLADRKCYVAQP
jgi:hypothetical protein